MDRLAFFHILERLKVSDHVLFNSYHPRVRPVRITRSAFDAADFHRHFVWKPVVLFQFPQYGTIVRRAIHILRS